MKVPVNVEGNKFTNIKQKKDSGSMGKKGLKQEEGTSITADLEGVVWAGTVGDSSGSFTFGKEKELDEELAQGSSSSSIKTFSSDGSREKTAPAGGLSPRALAPNELPQPAARRTSVPKLPARSLQQPPEPTTTLHPSSTSSQPQEQPSRSSQEHPLHRKSLHPPIVASELVARRKQLEPIGSAHWRTSSYTSAGVVYSRSPRRKMQVLKNDEPGGKETREEFEKRLQKEASLPNVTQQQQQHIDLSSDIEDADSGDEDSAVRPPLRRITAPSSTDFNNKLSTEDIEICRRLDEEYERALEEREIGYNARYASVRQSAFLSVFFMVAYLFLGTAFFARQTAWTIPESLLFSIYTITTVGYGRSDIPTTPGFQSYTIFYILVGIAALTIMVAQVYQCIALEASRAQHGRDKTEMARRGLDILTTSQRTNTARGNVHGDASADEIIAYHNDNMPGVIDSAFRCYDRAKLFFRDDEVGRSISVVFPFAGLILIGAVVVGPIEGWSFLESVYFSVVSLTTVGFGDYVPRAVASIWFCVMWLPFSVGFMSLYLGNVAAFYIRLSDRNIQRIERQMRRRVERAKEKAERERAEVLQRAYRGQEVELEAVAVASEDGSSVDEENSQTKIPPQHAKSLLSRKRSKKGGFDALPTNESFGSDEGSNHSLFGSTPNEKLTGKRRQRILENSTASIGSVTRPDGRTMQSMRDIVRAVRRNLTTSQKPSEAAAVVRSGPDVQFMSIRSTQTMPSHHTMLRRAQRRKPSFALRVLVQERFAEIIATEIAGYQSSIEIKDNTLSVTIDSMQGTANKWLIPRRARKAFRAVAFEVLYFVGEHGLITRGADALYDLSPFEFHGLFSPLVAAMGDAETMEGWLASTDILADVDLRRDGTRPGLSTSGDGSRLTESQQERLKKNLSNRTLNETLNHSKLQKISPGSAFQT